MGTPQELTDENGEVVCCNYEYAWGGRYTHFYKEQSLNGCAIIESDLQSIRFQGQSLDAETGLHYNRFRYYDSDVGMFIQRDPIGLLGGNNVFAYAPNPIHWVDVLGLSVRKQLYPSRVRKSTRKKLEENSNGVCATPGCNNTFDVADTSQATVQHNPPLYQTHNDIGYNVNQKTRNDLYNATAESLVCLDCQKKEGGSLGKNDRYRNDTGENFEARKPRKKRKNTCLS